MKTVHWFIFWFVDRFYSQSVRHPFVSAVCYSGFYLSFSVCVSILPFVAKSVIYFVQFSSSLVPYLHRNMQNADVYECEQISSCTFNYFYFILYLWNSHVSWLTQWDLRYMSICGSWRTYGQTFTSVRLACLSPQYTDLKCISAEFGVFHMPAHYYLLFLWLCKYR